MSCRLRGAVVLAALLAVTSGVSAHHSILGQFDLSKTITLTGTISKVDWINPHPYVHLQTRAANGTVTTWGLSAAPLAMLRKVGLRKESLAGKPGETVTIVAHPALNGRPLGWIRRITYADGHYYSLGES